ncbi:MAG: hypothetical protein AB8F95_18980 [Bacteroidia bacterium]
MKSRNRLILHLVGTGLLIAPFVIFFFGEGTGQNWLRGFLRAISPRPIGIEYPIFIISLLALIATTWSILQNMEWIRRFLTVIYFFLWISYSSLLEDNTDGLGVILIIVSAMLLSAYYFRSLVSHKPNFRTWRTWQYLAAVLAFSSVFLSFASYGYDKILNNNSGLSLIFDPTIFAILIPSICALIAYITYARDAWLQFHNPEKPLEALIDEMGK